MQYIFLDESGNVVPFQKAECFLVVAVLAATARTARAIESHVKRLRVKGKRPARTELKASEATGAEIERLLQAIADEDVAVAAIVLDKRKVRRMPDDPEDWYRDVAGQLVRRCLERWPKLQKAVLDKRYTNVCLRDQLEAAIREKIVGLPGADLEITQPDSKTDRRLQAVDYVAWAIRQRYEKNNDHYYRLIEHRVIIEEVIKAK